MSGQRAMGHDPLDWIGHGPRPGEPRGTSRRLAPGRPGASKRNRVFDPDPASDPGSRTGNGLIRGASVAPDSDSALPAVALENVTTAASLERELLLMGQLERPAFAFSPASPTRRRNQWLLFLVVLFGVSGIALFLFQGVQSRWRDHVQGLTNQIRGLEKARDAQVAILGRLLESKDRLLAEQERTIRTLEERPGTILRRRLAVVLERLGGGLVRGLGSLVAPGRDRKNGREASDGPDS